MKKIDIVATSELDAFRQVFEALYSINDVPSDPELYKEAVLDLQIEGVETTPRIELTSKEEFLVKYDYDQLIPGGSALAVEEKKYWEDQFFGKQDRVRMIVNHLKAYPDSKRALVNFWDEETMNFDLVAACLISLYFRVANGKLHMVANFRANDAYRNIIIDLDMLKAVQAYIAGKLELEMGVYFYFVDNLHLRRKYLKEMAELHKVFKKSG